MWVYLFLCVFKSVLNCFKHFPTFSIKTDFASRFPPRQLDVTKMTCFESPTQSRGKEGKHAQRLGRVQASGHVHVSTELSELSNELVDNFWNALWINVENSHTPDHFHWFSHAHTHSRIFTHFQTFQIFTHFHIRIHFHILAHFQIFSTFAPNHDFTLT